MIVGVAPIRMETYLASFEMIFPFATASAEDGHDEVQWYREEWNEGNGDSDILRVFPLVDRGREGVKFVVDGIQKSHSSRKDRQKVSEIEEEVSEA